MTTGQGTERRDQLGSAFFGPVRVADEIEHIESDDSRTLLTAASCAGHATGMLDCEHVHVQALPILRVHLASIGRAAVWQVPGAETDWHLLKGQSEADDHTDACGDFSARPGRHVIG